MQELHFSITIDAPREKVWNAMLGDATYREWTTAFHPGSYFKGDWSAGSKMLFLGPNPETGKEGGMFAEIAESRPPEFVSIRHLGEVKEDSTEVPWPESASFENYTLKEQDGKTEVLVDLTGLPDEFKDMFDDSWPKALEKLKEVAER